jgi:serine protease
MVQALVTQTAHHLKKAQRLFTVVCATLALAQTSLAGELPWYLAVDSPRAAPASLQTAPIKPGSTTIVVAVIDSGVIQDHPALHGVLLAGFDMVDNPRNLRGGRSPNFQPDNRDAACGRNITSSSFRTHGTEVASIVAGNGYDNMWGVNPKAQIVPIRVFGACGMAPEDLIDGIRWAAGLSVRGVPTNANPAKVINVSIAGGAVQCRPALQSAINEATRQGAFVVAAAGNNFQRALAEPGNCSGVISVGALSAENQITNYSALDARTSIYTVGGGPPLRNNTPWADNKIRIATVEIDAGGSEKLVVSNKGVGTSFAAPLVSGFLSLWLSHQPNLKPADWQSNVEQFVRSVPPLAKCPECKPYGLVVQRNIVEDKR